MLVSSFLVHAREDANSQGLLVEQESTYQRRRNLVAFSHIVP